MEWVWVKASRALTSFRTSILSQEADDDPNSYRTYSFQNAFTPLILFGIHSSNLIAVILGTIRGAERSSLLSGVLSQYLLSSLEPCGITMNNSQSQSG